MSFACNAPIRISRTMRFDHRSSSNSCHCCFRDRPFRFVRSPSSHSLFDLVRLGSARLGYVRLYSDLLVERRLVRAASTLCRRCNVTSTMHRVCVCVRESLKKVRVMSDRRFTYRICFLFFAIDHSYRKSVYRTMTRFWTKKGKRRETSSWVFTCRARSFTLSRYELNIVVLHDEIVTRDRRACGGSDWRSHGRGRGGKTHRIHTAGPPSTETNVSIRKEFESRWHDVTLNFARKLC